MISPAEIRTESTAILASDWKEPPTDPLLLETGTVDEVTRLKRCLSDLVAVLALPAMWAGLAPSRVATTLLEVLVQLLRADFAYLRATVADEGQSSEWMLHAQEACDVLDRTAGGGTVSIATCHLGYKGATVGICVVGSRRTGFPTEGEQLVLQVAVNQAAVALREARRVREQRQTTEELERRVAERTAELSAVNQALRDEIAQRARTEQALSETEDRLTRMADSIPEVIWITDLEPAERIVYSSRSFERVWGLRLEDLYRNPRLWTETIHPDDRERVENTFSRWIAGADVSYKDVEFRIVRPDGSIRWIHERGVLTVNEQGRPIRVSEISTDITDRKRAQEKRLQERLDERMRIARDLHDTLLQSCQGVLLKFRAVTYMLPDRPAEARSLLDATLEQARHAMQQGRDAVQGLRSSTTAGTDLSLAIGALGESLAADVADQPPPKFRVHVEGTPTLLAPHISDEVYLIAGEALRNAFRHARATRIDVDIACDHHLFRLCVRDNGKGIDPAVLADNENTGHFGLATMRERGELVGGTLTVRSERDAGTEIELTIPG